MLAKVKRSIVFNPRFKFFFSKFVITSNNSIEASNITLDTNSVYTRLRYSLLQICCHRWKLLAVVYH